MKIRSNYVSNSSSSSFVILCHKITDNPLKAINEGKNVFVYIEACGTSGSVGDWYFKLTEEIYNIINHHSWFKPYAKPVYYECPEDVSVNYDDDVDGKLIVKNDIVDYELFAFERDYSSPENVDDLKQFLKNH